MPLQHIALFPPVIPPTMDQPPLGDAPSIHPSAWLHDCRIGSWTEIGPNTQMSECTVGDYTYTSGDVMALYTDIGKFCSIASHVRVNPSNHPMERVSQHHFTYRRVQYGFDSENDAGIFTWRRADRCQIGHDVWLGHAVTVMPGVKIGIGAVVGSGAVVTKDIGPYEIAVGVPARPIRKRFSEEVIAAMLRIAWWDWDHETIKARFHDFLDTPAFIARYNR
jgi:phosphonate metabolism protein (transferase hexapeptide repeat family)